MCDNHVGIYDEPDFDDPSRHVHHHPSRRDVGKGALALAAGALLVPFARGTARAAIAAAPATPTDLTGATPLSMAMHVHSSFSEQSASMDAQLNQAAKNDVAVLWWTDHDARMEQFGYRSVVHFTSLTGERTDGGPWLWQARSTGSPASSAGGIVTSPASPNDSIAGGSLHVSAACNGDGPASYGYYAESHPAGWNYHGNVNGQTLSIDVLPTSIGSQGYLELSIMTSYRYGTAGRPAGVYQLSYRFGGPGTPGTSVADGILGIVTVPVTPGQWNTATVTPMNDIAALWPDLLEQDFATSAIQLNAVSLGAPAEGYFDNLEFVRQYVSGNLPLQLQQSLEAAYAVDYPTVAQRQGLEVSRSLPHLNWFGGAIDLPDYTDVAAGDNSPAYEAFLADLVGSIHTAGGLVSYNHPFGYGGGPVLPAATQNALVSSVAASLLADGVLGCDILEVGYVSRNGVDLAHHVALWDVLSRNAVFVTGNGVTDDHFGVNWYGLHNNWTTTAWALSDAEADLLAALAAGRAWCSSLSRFAGTVDLLVDGVCPMGSVSISTVPSRQLQVIATGVPVGGSVQVVRGVVDYTGTTPTSAVVATIPASQFTGGAVSVTVDTTSSCFVRTQVRDSKGIVALSNPVWMLLEVPTNGIPTPRSS